MARDFQVVGIGNAIVDLFSRVDEVYLKEHNIKKNVMNLIDYDRAKSLLNQINIEEKVKRHDGRCSG